MSQLLKQAKQVLKNSIAQIEKRLREVVARCKQTDDTVEAQAQTFKIWMWSSAAGLTLIVLVSVISKGSNESGSAVVSSREDVGIVDQLPEGFVIAPIDPINSDSLDSIFEQHGFADIYKTNDRGDGKGERIARGLGLIRAPRNPRRFAVLVPEEQSHVLGELNEPVLVILRKRPPKGGYKSEKQVRSKRKSRERILVREPHFDIDLIEEALPATAQN